MKDKELIIKLLDLLRDALLDGDNPKSFASKKGHGGKTSGTYQVVYGRRFREIYDKIECSGKPIRGSGHRLTTAEFAKVVSESHAYAKEQRDLGYPDDR